MAHKDKCKFLLLNAKKLKERNQISSTQYNLLKELIFSFDEELYECSCSSTVKERIDRYTRYVYDDLFEGLSLERAHIIATTYADELSEGDTRALVYGEVDFDSFAEVLRCATDGIARSKKFIDLGHGIGRAVIVASLLCNFEEYIGIEILKGLYETSMNVLFKYKQNVEPILSQECGVVCLAQGSFLSHEEDWADADLVFANSTCFPDELIEDIATRCRKLAVKSRVITFTTSLRSEYFKIIFKKRLFMSWGPATVFIHERISDEDVMPGVYDRFSQSHRVISPHVPASEQATDTSSVGSGSALSTNPVPPVHLDDESSLATTPSSTVITTFSVNGEWDPDTPTLKAWAKQELDMCKGDIESISTDGVNKSGRTYSLSSQDSSDDDGDMELSGLNIPRLAFKSSENGIYTDDDDDDDNDSFETVD